MPGPPLPPTDECELLLASITRQRDGIRHAAEGLSDDQARLTPTAGALSIGGLLEHVTAMESHWMDVVLRRDAGAPTEERRAGDEDDFRMRDGETLAGLLARYEEVARETEAVVAGIADLATPVPVPVPKGVPWFPDDIDAWSLRWVLLHLVEETARHTGHADIVRESIDAATRDELMAGAEGRLATDWLQPCRPGS